MLNKELLLVNSEEELEYTHVITVGKNGYEFGFGRFDAHFGDISPTTFLDEDLSYVETDAFSQVTTVQINALLPASRVYLGRTDTQRVVELREIYTAGGKASEIVSFFGSEDVGKSIKLWIAETPPLGLRILLRRGGLC